MADTGGSETHCQRRKAAGAEHRMMPLTVAVLDTRGAGHWNARMAVASCAWRSPSAKRMRHWA